MKSELKSDVIFTASMVVAAAVLGGVINLLLARPLPWVYRDKPGRLELNVSGLPTSRPLKPQAGERNEITLTSLREGLAEGALNVVDARPRLFFNFGHVPGALSLPREDFATAYAKVGPQLPKDRALVVYCASETCEDAGLVRDALERMGYTRVLVFPGGWEAWQAAGQPEEKSG